MRFLGAFSLALAVLLGPLALAAQVQHTPVPGAPQQAQPRGNTPQEQAAFETLQREASPDVQIKLAEDFLLKYPNSPLKELVFQTAARAYEAKGDYAHAATYGELTLGQNPDNVPALLVVSTAISEMTSRDDADRDERLNEADQYAHHALELLDALQPPAGAADAEWSGNKREAESAAHAALGLSGLLREDFERAEPELQEAVDLTAHPDAVLLYRLGLSQYFVKKYDLALESLEKAEALGGVRIPGAQGARRDLAAEARDFVMRARAAAPAEADPQAGEQGATQQAPASAPSGPAATAPTPSPAAAGTAAGGR